MGAIRPAPLAGTLTAIWLRVFLKRIWTGQPLDTKSWAVQREPDMLEREIWAHYLVDLYASDLRVYADRLSREFGARAPAGATP